MLVGSRAYSVNAQRRLKPFSGAFVEAGPAACALVFAAGGGAVAACGEGVHREVAEEILQLLCGDLSKYTPLVASDCLDSVVQKFASFRASGWAGYS